MTGSENPASGLGYAERVERLMKLPGHLCKQRGICCRIATFKGMLQGPEILALAAQVSTDEGSRESEMARDFLSVFEPYETQKAVQALAPEFVERANASAAEQGKMPESIGYFRCRYVLEDGRCGVHEDRPTGCRSYPLPHNKTLFHPGCGYEAQSKANWTEVEGILKELNSML